MIFLAIGAWMLWTALGVLLLDSKLHRIENLLKGERDVKKQTRTTHRTR